MQSSSIEVNLWLTLNTNTHTWVCQIHCVQQSRKMLRVSYWLCAMPRAEFSGEEPAFMVKTYYRTGSYVRMINAFHIQYPALRIRCKMTIAKTKWGICATMVVPRWCTGAPKNSGEEQATTTFPKPSCCPWPTTRASPRISRFNTNGFFLLGILKESRLLNSSRKCGWSGSSHCCWSSGNEHFYSTDKSYSTRSAGHAFQGSYLHPEEWWTCWMPSINMICLPLNVIRNDNSLI